MGKSGLTLPSDEVSEFEETLIRSFQSEKHN